ncbi:hypothetical protein [Maricaulis sp.]|uniref:hypothetical protein n=1 Tax=Maricaulis sp. TaxID=1486257 RepID=UPI0025C30231|nr:hypothetical protein [Maricaulis sp.]
MREYDPDKPLIFIHVPKTGGVSVRQVVDSWYPHRFSHYFSPKTGMPPRRDLSQRCADGSMPVVYGHFNRLRGFGIEQYYPEATQFITILRDPLETRISAYHYLKSLGDKLAPDRRPQGTLEEFLISGPVGMLNYFPVEMTEANYKDVIESSFIEVGILEALPESMRRIAARLSKPFDESQLPHLNRAVRFEGVSGEAKKKHKEINGLAYRVYDYVAARYSQ